MQVAVRLDNYGSHRGLRLYFSSFDTGTMVMSSNSSLQNILPDCHAFPCDE